MMKIDEIKVATVDAQKLKDYLQIKLPENQELHLDKFALFSDKYCIDSDCCFWKVENEYFNNNIQPVIRIYARIIKYKGTGSYSIRMDDYDFVKTISLEDYVSMSKEVNLIDFIRYNYNPRIIKNQKLLMKHINTNH